MEKTPRANVFVLASGEHVQTAVAGALARTLGQQAEVRTGPPDAADSLSVIVATDDAASFESVSALAARGAHVVILAALPKQPARRRYSEAGARAYVPMTLSRVGLVSIVRALVTMLAEAA